MASQTGASPLHSGRSARRTGCTFFHAMSLGAVGVCSAIGVLAAALWWPTSPRQAVNGADEQNVVFDILLDRSSGELLGVDLDPGDGVTLQIRSLLGGGGLVSAWNSMSVGREVQWGDRILAVNNVSGSSMLLVEELKKHQPLRVTLTRNLTELATLWPWATAAGQPTLTSTEASSVDVPQWRAAKTFAFESWREIEVGEASEPHKQEQNGEFLQRPSASFRTREAVAKLRDAGGLNASVRLLAPLFNATETASLLRRARVMEVGTDDVDSVDFLPTFEASILSRGIVRDAQMVNRMRVAIETRLHPYVRSVFNCSHCIVCDVFMRRILPGERRDHPWHYDNEAFISAVVSLSSAADFVGGLYLQRGYGRDAREYIAMDAGDAVIHSYDLRHGVEVEEGGERFSLVIWIKDSPASCRAGVSPWFDVAAREGNAAAMCNLGSSRMSLGNPDDAAIIEAHKWWSMAAERGHLQAQYNLGVMLNTGVGSVVKNRSAACSWFFKAAHHGHRLAMSSLAFCYEHGVGVPQNSTESFSWIRKAAEEGLDTAQYQVGAAYKEGTNGLQRNPSEATRWLNSCAKRGNEDCRDMLRSTAAGL